MTDSSCSGEVTHVSTPDSAASSATHGPLCSTNVETFRVDPDQWQSQATSPLFESSSLLIVATQLICDGLFAIGRSQNTAMRNSQFNSKALHPQYPGLSGKAHMAMPRSSPMSIAAFSPTVSATLYVLAPTFEGQIERSSRSTNKDILRSQGGSGLLTRELEARGAVNV